MQAGYWEIGPEHRLRMMGLLTIAYFLAAVFGLQWAQVDGAGSPFWPAFGVSLAFLVIGGAHLWPAIFIGRLAAGIAVGSGQPLWAEIAIALANAIADGLAVAVLTRIGGLDLRLATMRDVMLLALTVCGSAMVSASLGTATLTYSSGLALPEAFGVWLGWWSGNVVAGLTLAPLILTLYHPDTRRALTARAHHFVICLAVNLVVAAVLLGQQQDTYLRLWHLYPGLIWAALAFGPAGAAAVLTCISAMTIWSATVIAPIFFPAGASVAQRIFFAQQFVAISSLTIMLLAAVADERRAKTALLQRERALARANRRLEVVLQSAALGSWHWRHKTGQLDINERWAEILGYQRDEIPPSIVSWEERIHPDDLPAVSEALNAHLEGRTPVYSAEHRLRHKNGEWVWVLTSGRTVEREADGAPAITTGIHLDITARKEAEEKLQETQRRLDAVLNNATVSIFLMDERQHCIYMNPAAEKLTGYRFEETQGKPLHDVIHHTRPDGSYFPLEECAIDRAFPEDNHEQGEEVFVHKDGRFYPVAFTASPIHDEASNTIGTIIEVRDIAEEKRTARQQRLLIDELNHRVKNTLSIVQGIAQQSFRGPSIPAQLRGAFEGRLAALSAAHDILTRQKWESASLHQIIGDAIGAVRAHRNRTIVDGPELMLPPKAAVSFTMALHELATNAVKYGSLSVPEGQVTIRWTIADGRLNLRWEESGGPEVSPPTTTGFGRRMIERALAADLGGKAALHFLPGGVVCEIDAALPRQDDSSTET